MKNCQISAIYVTNTNSCRGGFLDAQEMPVLIQKLRNASVSIYSPEKVVM